MRTDLPSPGLVTPREHDRELAARLQAGPGRQPEDFGTKLDDGKAPWHLLAWDAILIVVLVLKFGAKKYAERNWEKGISYSRCFAAAQRHLVAWWAREDNDPETQLNHLAHAICEIMFALAFVVRGRVDLDDRPALPKAA